MKTHAYVVAEKGAPFVWQEVELAEPEPNEVLVEVKACGVCATDTHVANSVFPSPFPNVAGHEGAGKVLKVGSTVTRVKEGDSVLLSFSYCGECGPCKTKHPAACEKFQDVNFGRFRNSSVGSKAGIKAKNGEEIYGALFGQSAFGKHALVVENSVVKVPDGTDLVALAPLGCGIQTGSGAVFNLLKPEKDSSIAIFGMGAVGISALFAARVAGVQQIVVVDVAPAKLEMAKKFGATHTFNGKDEDVVKKVKATTLYNAGVKYAIECSGNVQALKTAWEMTANRGHLVSCGTPGPGISPPFGIFENLLAAKTYTGLTEGDSNPVEFIPFLIDLYDKGQFPVDKISKRFRYDELDKAIQEMKTGETVKPILVFD